MEQRNLLKDTRKHFSSLGLRLFIGTLIIYGVQYLALTIMNVIGETNPSIGYDVNIRFLATMLPMYAIAYPAFFLMMKQIPSQSTGEAKKMKFSQMFVAFLILYAGIYLSNIIGNIITAIIGIFKQGTVTNVMMELTGSINPIVNFLIVVICAPIMEELLFRKTLMDRTAAYGEGVSVVLSGLLFSLFHGNLNQFVYTFFMGAFFGFIYIKTRNIVYPIILHMIANFMGSVVSSLLLKFSGLYEIDAAVATVSTEAELMNVVAEHAVGLIIFFVYALCLIAFVIAGIVLFFVNRKKFSLQAGEITIQKGKRFLTIICNLGMGLFCIFWLINIVVQLFQ
uniref:CPBP family intramembrane glutamic endopeptidase n=1 Tax=Acetatifactor sp. TaxID=1872090 RepID=UPI004055D042